MMEFKIFSPASLTGLSPSYFSIVLVGTLSALFASLAVTFFSRATKVSFPIINPSKKQFRENAKELMSKGFKKFSGPFCLQTDTGPLIMLSPDHIEDVNQEKSLDFMEFMKENLLAQLHTFKLFAGGPAGMFQDVVRKSLTRSLPKFTQVLSDETDDALRKIWTDDKDWHSTALMSDVVRLIAQLSARVFVGSELARDPEWIKITSEYTVSLFLAVQEVKAWPGPLRPIVQWFLPLSRKAREQLHRSRKLLKPILAKRAEERREAQKNGEPVPFHNDSFDWFELASKGRDYDDAGMQLGLSMAAIHTTSDLLTEAIFNLCAHPEALEPMRKEALDVLKSSGWQKTALYDLRLVDSFFKETQRMKPIAAASMSRKATKDITLPSGLAFKKGENLAISSHRLWDESYYEDPETFDPFRFAKRRQIPGYEHKSVLVATSPDFTAFSHGRHACPGRFFAANEAKIALVHIILKYDLRLAKDVTPRVLPTGLELNADPFAKIEVRRRQEEFTLN